ncbi:hypothetical protein OJF2_79250 (plasmid) [Aquisphaera giovannonii]|uniref:Uncharacterized protein n=1 Tax=Aquisphaera giovannonii TaxID=406548 RepID=A0A5B9WHR8_9BACT|nr:hypothetical protein [Aquisphaera giovannonii]QEH39310.1 hypothetical protein OJF2_79250 [Aquisphaera giovannonii]
MPLYNSPAAAPIADEYYLSRWIAERGIDLDGPDVSDDELEARTADGDESDPETWGEEWDDYRWELNAPPADEDPAFVPDDDRRWWAGQDVADELDARESWLEYEDWASRLDAMAAAAGCRPECLTGCHEIGGLI